MRCLLQIIFHSRSRLNSGRTLSESSEGCGTAADLEISEAGSLKRHRQRVDSAYMSQRDSMSCGPPETPSPEVEEEDQNGYVLPGDSPERGDSVIHVCCLIRLHGHGSVLFSHSHCFLNFCSLILFCRKRYILFACLGTFTC